MEEIDKVQTKKVLKQLDIKYLKWRSNSNNLNSETLKYVDNFHKSVLGYIESLLIFECYPIPDLECINRDPV